MFYAVELAISAQGGEARIGGGVKLPASPGRPASTLAEAKPDAMSVHLAVLIKEQFGGIPNSPRAARFPQYTLLVELDGLIDPLM